MNNNIVTKSASTRLYDAIISPYSPIPSENLRDVRLVASIALVTIIALFLRLLFGVDAVILASLVAVIVAYGLSRTAYWKIAGLIIVTVLAAPSLVNLVTEIPGVAAEQLADWGLARVSWLALAMMLASVFFSWRGTFLYGIALIVAMIFAASLNPDVVLSSMIGSIALLGILTALLILSVRHRDMVERDRQEQLVTSNEALTDARDNLEGHVRERTIELEDVNQELNQLNDTLEKRIEERVEELNLSQEELKAAQNTTKGIYTTIDVLLKQLRSVFHHKPSREELSSYMTILEAEYEKLSTYFDN